MQPSFYTRIGKRQYSTFSFLATMGCGAAIAFAVILASLRELNLLHVIILLLLSFLDVLIFYAIHYIITGNKALTFYRYQIFIVLANALFISVLDFSDPILLIDLSFICIGAFQFVGRIGCFHAGCCHGRPCRFGVVYAHEVHKKHGFPQPYLGVRLLPVQLISASYILLLVAISSLLFLNRNLPPGTVTVLYITGYSLCRFITEFLRGDTDRIFIRTLSEAQVTAWTSCVAVVMLQVNGVLPLYGWSFFIGLLLTTSSLALLIVSFLPWLSGVHLVFRPDVNVELYQCIRSLNESTLSGKTVSLNEFSVIQSSSGVSISMQQLPSEENAVLYTVSSIGRRMNRFVIRFVFSLIRLQMNRNARLRLLKHSRYMAQLLVQ